MLSFNMSTLLPFSIFRCRIHFLSLFYILMGLIITRIMPAENAMHIIYAIIIRQVASSYSDFAL